MALTLEGAGQYSIHSYGPEGIVLVLPDGVEPLNPPHIDGTPARRLDTITGSFLITPDGLHRDWIAGGFEALERNHFAELAELTVDVVLLGTGARLRMPHPALSAPLAEAGIGLEVMDTIAACRTLNVLLSENRRVAAGFLPLDD